MRFITHIFFTIFCTLFFLKYIPISSPILFVSIAVFMTLFVDIDEPDSKIGKMFWLIAKPIQFLFGHRGIFHSILVPIALYCILTFFNMHEIALASALGYVSHLFMDMLTPHGIYPLYPLQWRIHGPIPCGSFLEYFLAFTLLAGILIMLLL